MRAYSEEVERICARPYKRVLIPDSNRTWFAEIAEFPGCMTVGTDEFNALEMLNDAMRRWVESCLEEGIAIPEPGPEE